MAREFITRDQDADDDLIMESIAAREQELGSYDANVTIYEQQATTLKADESFPNKMPDELASLKGKTNEQIKAMGVSDADALKASQVNHLARVEMLHFTEQAERRKSELAYQALLDMLPAGPRRDAALARYQAKEAARKAGQ